MRNTEQTLKTAIGELRCVSPDRPASLSELTALSAARSSIDELIRSCVSELRADTLGPATWTEISYALDNASPRAARRRHGSMVVSATGEEDDQILAFWNAFAKRFAWDFLPVDFLYALYLNWMRTDLPPGLTATVFTRRTFVRRIKTPATASGEWIHRRSRTGSLMEASEPLENDLTGWIRDDSNAAIQGFRRRSTMKAPALEPEPPNTTDKEQTR
jgi:hypothetical protein